MSPGTVWGLFIHGSPLQPVNNARTFRVSSHREADDIIHRELTICEGCGALHLYLCAPFVERVGYGLVKRPWWKRHDNE